MTFSKLSNQIFEKATADYHITDSVDAEINSAWQKLLSFYKADLYERITVGDTILYEGGQQTKVILSKG